LGFAGLGFLTRISTAKGPWFEGSNPNAADDKRSREEEGGGRRRKEEESTLLCPCVDSAK
jgi:hypothetical protein